MANYVSKCLKWRGRLVVHNAAVEAVGMPTAHEGSLHALLESSQTRNGVVIFNRCCDQLSAQVASRQ